MHAKDMPEGTIVEARMTVWIAIGHGGVHSTYRRWQSTRGRHLTDIEMEQRLSDYANVMRYGFGDDEYLRAVGVAVVASVLRYERGSLQHMDGTGVTA